jgi:hypothetical protein
VEWAVAEGKFVAFAERELLSALHEEYGQAEAATIRVR